MLRRKSLLFLIPLLIAAVMISPFGLRINISESLPYYVFLSKKAGKIERNSYVSFSFNENRYPLVKQIAGIPGDIIEYTSEDIFVNGKNYGKVLEKTPSGMPVSPLNCKEIPEGFIFVFASHQNSFDSRYEEFGLIAIDRIEEELWPLF